MTSKRVELDGVCLWEKSDYLLSREELVTIGEQAFNTHYELWRPQLLRSPKALKCLDRQRRQVINRHYAKRHRERKRTEDEMRELLLLDTQQENAKLQKQIFRLETEKRQLQVQLAEQLHSPEAPCPYRHDYYATEQLSPSYSDE